MLERQSYPDNVYYSQPDASSGTYQPEDTDPQVAQQLEKLPPAKIKIAKFLLKKAETLEEFEFSEVIIACRIPPREGVRMINETLHFIKETFGLKMLSIVQDQEGGGYHIITKQVSTQRTLRSTQRPSESEWNDEETIYANVIKNLKYIPAKYHEILLLLNLSSHYTVWLSYEEIETKTGKTKKEIYSQLVGLEKYMANIGIRIITLKVNGVKYVILLHKDENEDEIYSAFEVDGEDESGEVEKTEKKVSHTTLIRNNKAKFSTDDTFEIALSLAEAADDEKAKLSAQTIAEFICTSVQIVIDALEGKSAEVPRVLRRLGVSLKKEKLTYGEKDTVFYIENK